MNDELEIQRLHEIINTIPESSPLRALAEILTKATEQNRINEEEYKGIMMSFCQIQGDLIEANNEMQMLMDNYVKVFQRLNETKERLEEAEANLYQAFAWLHDPLVKPFFLISLYIEMGLNWIRGKPA
jgi:hypothetical protein